VDPDHRSATQVRGASTNDVALRPPPLRQPTAKRNGVVVREKNASGGERKERGESDTVGARTLTRVVKSTSVIAIAKQSRPHCRTAFLVTRDHDPAACVANSPETKTSGWRSLRLLVHLSLPYPILSPLQAFHRPLHLGPPRGWPATVTRLTRM
jgi:hypothetical protein